LFGLPGAFQKNTVSQLFETKILAVRSAFTEAGLSPAYKKKHVREVLPELFFLNPKRYYP
jgi:hypothetical protein